MTFNSRVIFKTIVGLCLIILDVTAAEASRELDLSFGDRGRAIVQAPEENRGAAVALQPDGKIVTGGSSSDRFALTRHNADGVLDVPFGVAGRVVSNISGSILTIAVQTNGKIVAAGFGWNGTQSGVVVARFNADGTTDVSFNGTGSKLITFPGYDTAQGFDSVIQPDGKILVAGYAYRVVPPPEFRHLYAIAVVRLNIDGTFDTSFNSTGLVLTNFSDLNLAIARAIALQSDGKIVVAGATKLSDKTAWISALVRYNSNGSLDTSFGNNGRLTSEKMSDTTDLLIQADGKIVTAGREFQIARYNPTGTLDNTFDGDGLASVTFGGYSHSSNSMALEPDGRIVIAGVEYDIDPKTNETFYYGIDVARLTVNGSPDDSLCRDGKISGSLGPGHFAQQIVIQSDGRIVAAGWVTGIDGYDDFLLARFRSASYKPFDFDGDGRSDVSVFRPADRTWYLNRSTQGLLSTQFGLESDELAPADYDGDGKTDIAVFRDGMWWRMESSNQVVTADNFGQAGDIPVPADYTGDGQDELAVYRDGEWWSFDLSNDEASVVHFGLASDRPIPVDYDGDGRVDQAVYRGGEWHLNRSTDGYSVQQFGLPSDRPVASDYDGDGTTDLAVFRGGTWHVLQTTDGYSTFTFGLPTDIPTPADFDGDGKTDAAVFRGGTWWIQGSTSGVVTQHFGLPDDRPVPVAFAP